jgi:hypothetical protein
MGMKKDHSIDLAPDMSSIRLTWDISFVMDEIIDLRTGSKYRERRRDMDLK